MSGLVDERLLRLLGGETLAALRRRLRRRFERTPPDAPVDSLQLGGLSPEEHAALAALLGRSQRFTASMRVDIARIDAALSRAGIAGSLREALEHLDGPIRDPAGDRRRQQALWADLVDGCANPDLVALLRQPTGLGLLKRLAKQDAEAATRLRDRADAVLRRLPAAGVTRAKLAAEVLGDAHALDGGAPTATLVLAARRRIALPAEIADEGDTVEMQVERARDVWARAGVLVNELARPALFLNLPASGFHHLPGEPGYASLRFLLRSPPAWAVAGRLVHVCENPNLVAIAADALDTRSAPLVCADGMPAAAQRCLLTQLAQAGAQLRYHGDFDWDGLRIGNHVMRAYGALPWRFGATDYETAVAVASREGHRLADPAATASWDAALAPAMLVQGRAIAEEAVAGPLLEDLAGGGG